VCIILLTGQK